MATTYTVTANVKCWKKHECVDCGCLYRYLFERKVQGQGGTERAAHENAEKNVMRTLEAEVDVRPCPTCGRVQPDMVGQVKAGRHVIVAWVTLAAVALFVILGAAHALTYSAAGLALAAVALGVALVHLAIALPNPNADRERNRREAERFVDDGTVEITTKGREVGDVRPPAPTGLPHWLGILAILFSGLVMAAPAVAKTLGGWPTNDEFVPEVSGPGDEFRVRFTTPIEAVKGYWSGHPSVAVVNASEVGNVPVTATGSNTTWGNTISGKSVSNSTIRPYANVKLPADPKLVGKTLKLRLTMTVSYPHRVGSSFDNRQQQMTRDVEVKVAPPGAGAHYTRTFWLGTIIGGLLCTGCGFYLRSLAKELQKHAIPAEVESAKDEDDEDADRDPDADEDDDRPRRRPRDED